jgi:dolichyl-phosphate beta-glucosyltransferase
MNISVVIPAFNEASIIAQTIEKIKKYFIDHSFVGEIIVVDDCSTDDTLRVLQEVKNIKVLRNLKNHGKGYSVRKGVLAATGDWILFMDADNSTDITELDKFETYLVSFDILIASRALAESKIVVNQNKIKVFFGRLGNLVIRLLIDRRIKDSQCGFKIFNKKVQTLFSKMTLDGFGFDFELIYLVKKNNLKIKELPVTWVNDYSSSVKWWHYPKVFLEVFKVRINDWLAKYN